MLRDPSPEQLQLEMVSIDTLVPQDHLVRLVDAAIDFDFIRDEVTELYCKNNVRPATDPVQFFKILFIDYLFGVPSERRLIKEIQVNVAYHWFVGLSLTDKVIDHSTLSQNRIKRFKDSSSVSWGIVVPLARKALCPNGSMNMTHKRILIPVLRDKN